MNASRTAAALALAGAIFLAPTVAQADPWVDVSASGSPVTDGSTGQLGQPLLIQGTGCDNTSGTAVMGEFTTPLGDPALLTEQEQLDAIASYSLFQIEMPVSEEGSFEWSLQIPLDNSTGTWTARWYCASAPVHSLYDPAITWAAPVGTMTLAEAAPAAQAARTASVKTAAGAKTAATNAPAAATNTTISFGFDPDALPLVDRVAIPGKKAAELKARVDADIAQATKTKEALARLIQRFDPKGAAALRKPVTNAEYVTAAYLELTGKLPSAKALKASTARLDDNGLRVQVVEDIALTAHNAAWWIKQK